MKRLTEEELDLLPEEESRMIASTVLHTLLSGTPEPPEPGGVYGLAGVLGLKDKRDVYVKAEVVIGPDSDAFVTLEEVTFLESEEEVAEFNAMCLEEGEEHDNSFYAISSYPQTPGEFFASMVSDN